MNWWKYTKRTRLNTEYIIRMYFRAQKKTRRRTTTMICCLLQFLMANHQAASYMKSKVKNNNLKMIQSVRNNIWLSVFYFKMKSYSFEQAVLCAIGTWHMSIYFILFFFPMIMFIISLWRYDNMITLSLIGLHVFCL